MVLLQRIQGTGEHSQMHTFSSFKVVAMLERTPPLAHVKKESMYSITANIFLWLPITVAEEYRPSNWSSRDEGPPLLMFSVTNP